MFDTIYSDLYQKWGVAFQDDFPYIWRGVQRWVPAGFFINGASIPWLFQKPLCSPYDPRIIKFAGIHDWEYTIKLFPKHLADQQLREMLHNAKTLNSFQIEAIYRGVQFGGGLGWRDTATDLKYLVDFKTELVSTGRPIGRYGFI